MSDIKSWGEHVENKENQKENKEVEFKGKTHTAEVEFKGKKTNFTKDDEVKKNRDNNSHD